MLSKYISITISRKTTGIIYTSWLVFHSKFLLYWDRLHLLVMHSKFLFPYDNSTLLIEFVIRRGGGISMGTHKVRFPTCIQHAFFHRLGGIITVLECCVLHTIHTNPLHKYFMGTLLETIFFLTIRTRNMCIIGSLLVICLIITSNRTLIYLVFSYSCVTCATCTIFDI